MSGDLTAVETRLWQQGARRVAGVDEAGRGPIAGPVVAAAVVWRPGVAAGPVRDSKALSERQRDTAFAYVHEHALAWAVAMVGVEDVDRMNPLRAALHAMALAVQRLRLPVDRILVDGNMTLPLRTADQQAIVKGDARSVSIAAASIMAKVTRDRWMRRCDELFPGYGFAEHKGYGSATHIRMLRELGPCPIHRRSFAPVAGLKQGRRALDD